jgi:hypothetical protein
MTLSMGHSDKNKKWQGWVISLGYRLLIVDRVDPQTKTMWAHDNEDDFKEPKRV